MLLIDSCVSGNSGKNKSKNLPEIPPAVRMIRVYGDRDESNPPVIVLPAEKTVYTSPYHFNSITIELDVDADVPPPLVAKFYHCDFNWNISENIFVNSTPMRTSNFDWTSSTYSGDYFSYRGKINVPDPGVKFEFPGNWKVIIYEIGNDTVPLAEAKFFVVKPKAIATMVMYTDFYDIAFPVTNTGYNIETYVSSAETLFDNQLHSVVLYRDHRWGEPYVITQLRDGNTFSYLYRYKPKTSVGGFSNVNKIFRINGIPAENMYRKLTMTNLAEFPHSSAPVRIPFSNLRRNGNFLYQDNDGAMNTSFISSGNDDYVNVEFVLDPDGKVATGDVFISGSFNNWMPDASWQMQYDPEDRLYRCRNWVRRGDHDYLYGTGLYNTVTKRFEQSSFDFFEGNTAVSAHTFLAFVYYKEIDYGGYDSIIAVSTTNIYDNNGGN